MVVPTGGTASMMVSTIVVTWPFFKMTNRGSVCQLVIVEFEFRTDRNKDIQPTHPISYQSNIS